jgi:hypothetical protein
MRSAIVSFESAGLILRPRFRGPFTVAYGEILSAERRPRGRALRLHTRAGTSVSVACRGAFQLEIEDELRQRGVRIVDEWGAMITPTLADFELELGREPEGLRQSYDNA